MVPIKLLRLNPTDNDFLNQYSMNSGDLYYDKDEKTLVLFDGFIKGGIPLLRADLSNISGGGGGGAGTVNFGSKTLQAQAFIGDGSQLTNLPIPTNVATTDYVDNKFATPATETTLGTVKIGTGLSVTAEGLLTADGIADITELTNLTALQFTIGGQINEFSIDTALGGTSPSNTAVPTENAVKVYVDTAISNAVSGIDLDANGKINSGVSGQIGFYAANGTTISGTGTNLTWNSSTNTLTSLNLNVGNNLEVTNHIEVLGTATFDQTLEVTGLGTFNDSIQVTSNADIDGNVDIGGDLYVEGSANISEIFNDRLGNVIFSSGADFVIDAPGFVNVNNSRIVNLGTPLLATDAVNKAYVDGAASQFTGGTVPNAINITATTASTSTSTGALIVAGGGGIGGALYVGGTIFSGGSPVLTSLSGGFNGGTVTGTIFLNNTTQSTSLTTGAFRTTGGVGIARNLFVGGEARFNSIYLGNGTNSSGSGYVQNTVLGGGNPFVSNSSGLNNVVLGFNALSQSPDSSDTIAIGYQSQQNRSTGSSNIGIGSDTLLQNTGNNNIAIGHLAGSLLIGGNGNVIIGGNTGDDIDLFDNHVVVADGNGTIKFQFNGSGSMGLPTGSGISYGTIGSVLQSAGNLAPPVWASLDDITFSGGTVPNDTVFSSLTDSSSAANGAVVISGGLGVGKNVNIAGVTKLTNNTSSTATNNGTFVVTGGVGISENLNVGGSAVKFTGTTASTSTSTGVVVISGGLGVSGRINATDFTGTVGANSTSTGAFTSITGTSLTVNGPSVIEKVSEKMAALSGATGTVIHNTNTASIFYHTTPAANFTANFTNVPTTDNRILTFVLIVIQGAAPRIPNAVQIDGAAPGVALRWANNATPTGTANQADIFTFHLIRAGGAWRVIASAQGY